MMRILELLLCLACLSGASIAAKPASGRSVPDNPTMTSIFEADQSARKDSTTTDWDRMAVDDKSRRELTKALLETGALRSNNDFHHAAFIFQHGDTPGDYLLAHSLAIVAVVRGRADSAWIAAATLDRYLQAIGQPQIYGTQFRIPQGKEATQEPYQRGLV